MKKETIMLVQGSWKNVSAIAPQAAELFYQNLFAADPSLKPLFRGNMAEQGKKLMQMIGAAVGKLNDLETLVARVDERTKPPPPSAKSKKSQIQTVSF